ncbi:MAG TPA: hypothetical protein VHZ03_13545 [Trebonia sp.]|nr:hypothetical protein [Trebonia sp.]
MAVNAPSIEVRAAVTAASAFSRPRRHEPRSAAVIAVASVVARNRSPARTTSSASVALAKAGAVLMAESPPFRARGCWG